MKKRNFTEIDEVKREIIDLYKDDFFKIDDTGLIGRMYDVKKSSAALSIFTGIWKLNLAAN